MKKKRFIAWMLIFLLCVNSLPQLFNEVHASELSSTLEEEEESVEVLESIGEVDTSQMLEISPSAANVSYSAEIATIDEYQYYSFIPSSTRKMQFESIGELDTIIYIYDAEGNQLAYDDDDGEDNNFLLTYSFLANTQYCIKVKCFGSEIGTIKFTVKCVYDVTYNANGGSGGPSLQEKVYGTTLTLSTTKPTRSGYTFMGWSESSTATNATYSPGGSYTRDVSDILYAVWTDKECYTISYNANGGSGAPVSQTKAQGTDIILSSEMPVRFGYNFLGWSTSASATSASYRPKDIFSEDENTTLYAVWEYPMTMSSGWISMSPQITFANEYVYIIYKPSISGKVQFESEGDIDTQIYIYDAEGNQLAYDDDDGESNNFLLTYSFLANTQYYIKVKCYGSGTGTFDFTHKRVYDVKYDLNGAGGVIPDRQEKIHGETLTLRTVTPTRSGYMFLGWSTSSTATSASYQPGGSYTANEDVILYAVWKGNTYTINYDANGGSGAPSSQTKTHGTDITLSSTIPTRFGYDFEWWSTSSTATGGMAYLPGANFSSNEDTILYAYWGTPEELVIKETMSGTTNGPSIRFPGECKYYRLQMPFDRKLYFESKGDVDTQIYIYNASGEQLAFNDDGGENNNYQLTYSFFSDTEYYIKVKCKGSDTGKFSFVVWRAYDVTYNANGGSGAPSSQTKTPGAYLTLSTAEPTKSGYEFIGWSTSNTATSASYQPGGTYTANNDITLYAVWKANSYTISYDANGGSGAPSNQTKTHGTALTLSTTKPTRSGYTFLGWSTSSTATTASYQSGGSYTSNATTTLYAVWQKGCVNEHNYKAEITLSNCTEEGYTTYTCTTCGDSYVDNEVEALGHQLGEWKKTKEAGCTIAGEKCRNCTRCDYKETQVIKSTGHAYETVVTAPTCEEAGYSTHTCTTCGDSYTGGETEKLGHSFTNYISDKNATAGSVGTKTAKCNRCNATDTIPDTSGEIPVIPANSEVIRIFGASRYETGYEVADALKEKLGVEKFDAVVVATGKNFADALSGSYLAVQKDAPIILTNGKNDNIAILHDYIKSNVTAGGKVYILGGTGAVPANVEKIKGYDVVRLSGSTRYDTNLAILKEAGIEGSEIIVATGRSFADSLSASAAKLPILLVKPGETLNAIQKAIMKDMTDIYIIGGEGAVDSDIAAELAVYGNVVRVSGKTRYETSVEVANTFFKDVEIAVVASGKNFPDGLCGGPLAAALNAPLILTADGKTSAAVDYVAENAITGGYVLGGQGALADETVETVFGLSNKVYTVTFETNGGNYIESQTVKRGRTVEFPEIPEKEGFGFAGWYLSAECNNIFDFSTAISEPLTLYACWVNTSDTADSDKDGLTDAEEEFYGTNIHKADSDGDELNDFIEINTLGTDPLKKDSDNNGVADGEEDLDGDGLSNKNEIKNGWNPILKDSDFEGLDDNIEIEIGTDPLRNDTDEDGESDYEEYRNGTDPIIYEDPDEVIEKSYNNENFSIIGADVKPALEIKASREALESLKVTPVSNHFINSTIPGYIGEAYDFTMDGTFESAVLSMEFDKELLKTEGFCPTIYYYNEVAGELEELQTEVTGNVATAVLEHFSTYILLNKTVFDEIWSTEIKSPEYDGTEQKSGLDVVLAIDSSGSMSSNDGAGLRKEAALLFAEKIGQKDRVAVVDFDSSADVECTLTQDKEIINSAINSIDSSGGTNLSNAVSAGINILTGDTSSASKYKFIILLTDGEGSYSSSYSQKAVENDIQIYTIGLGSGVDEDILKQIANDTGGKYYFASSAENLLGIYELAAGETIDYVTDSNNDGISDYYTQLLVDGKLRVSSGTRVFGIASYEDIQANADYDGDGLLNGEELEVKLSSDGTRVHAKLKSSPLFVNSDNDEYNDYEEVKTHHTNPMQADVQIDSNHLADVKNASLYVSNDYKEFYDHKVLGSLEKGSIWLATHIFGTDYDHSMLYKKQFSEYFDVIKNGTVEEKNDAAISELAYSFSNNVLGLIGAYADYYGKYLNIPEDSVKVLKDLQNKALELDKMRLNASSSGFESSDDFYAYVDDLYKQYNGAVQEISDFKTDLKVSVNLDKIGKIGNVANAAGFVFVVIDVMSSPKETFDEYIKFVSLLDIMEENIYIYNAIINSDADDDLKSAATEIRNVLQTDWEHSITDLQEELGYKDQVKATQLGELGHYFAGLIPYVEYAELIVSVTDFCFNLSGVAKECLKLNCIATTANVMSDEFRTDSTAKAQLTKFINLIYARLEAERQMQDAVNENTWITEWLFKYVMYKDEDTRANINYLQGLLPIYLIKLEGL